MLRIFSGLRSRANMFLRKQRGGAMIMAVGFLFAGTAIVTGALVLASATSRATSTSIDGLLSHYAAVGASEYVMYRLEYEPGYADSLQPGVPSESTVTLNDQEVTVRVVMPQDPGTPPPLPSPRPGFLVTKEVTPTTATPNVLTTFTYTVHITNQDATTPQKLKAIWDILPNGFTYVSGSTSGITSSNPTMDGEALKWDLGPDYVDFGASESRTLTFQAQGQVPTGNYGNQVWVDPGFSQTYTGMTAKIVVGSPPNQRWQGPHVMIQKTASVEVVPAYSGATVTYTITLTNIGTDTLTLTSVWDRLPPGLTYINGSTSGFTTSNPVIWWWEGRQNLLWLTWKSMLPDTSRTLTFRTSADVAADNYYNEAGAGFWGIGLSPQTSPTAMLKVIGAFTSTATAGNKIVTFKIWKGKDDMVRTSWQVTTQ